MWRCWASTPSSLSLCLSHMACSPTPSLGCSYSHRKPTSMPPSSAWYLITSDAHHGSPLALLADKEQAERLLREHYPQGGFHFFAPRREVVN